MRPSGSSMSTTSRRSSRSARYFARRSGLFRVEIAGSAVEALEDLEEGKYDATISDYQMPGMDEIEFLKAVRKSGDEIPFILMSRKHVALLYPVSHTLILIESEGLYLIMKTLIDIHKEGRYFVAVDLLTNVADQGLSEEVAMQNLKKGLEEHYQLLIELTPQDHKLTYLDIEVDHFVENSSAVSS